MTKNNSMPTAIKCLFIAIPVGILWRDIFPPYFVFNPINQVYQNIGNTLNLVAVVWIVSFGFEKFKMRRNVKRGDALLEKEIDSVSTCSFCCENIKSEAILCRYCGRSKNDETSLDFPRITGHLS